MMGLLGRPAMPWQIDAANVTGELTAAADAMAYPYVVVIVPRRAGKTLTVLGTALHRCTTARMTRCAYTAQNGSAASAAFRTEWSPLLRSSPLLTRNVITLRRAAGAQAVQFPRLESEVALFAPTETAGHGTDTDLAIVDEAWAFTAEQGDRLEAAIQPSQLTRPFRQLWIVSAGGTDSSTWLARWRDLGRDRTTGVALIEYAADPTVDDLEDPDLAARVHPATGHTVTRAALEQIKRTMPRDEYQRAFLGVWTIGGGSPSKLPADAWHTAQESDSRPVDRVTFGLAVAVDGVTSAIVAAGTYVDPAGLDRIAIEVVSTGPGTAWVTAEWKAIRARTRGRLLVDPLSPAAPVIESLQRARLPVETVSTGQYASACAQMYDDVLTGRLAHRGQPLLTASALSTPPRPVGDRWLYRRGEHSAPIEAATLAAFGTRAWRGKPTATAYTP